MRLAFAGDVHFELHLARLLDDPRGALGPITPSLAEADLAMVNLETAITDRGTRMHDDSAFRTSPEALDMLGAAGVDVVSMANNHAVDYGPVGFRDTLRAAESAGTARVRIVGIGRNRQEAFEPYRRSVRGTRFAIFAASSEPDQLVRSAATRRRAGIAAAFDARPRRLVHAVRSASQTGDVVVVYLHWGSELEACPTDKQRVTAQALVKAGADIVVGSHAHVLLGSGWLARTYVNYGLGNFLWYHNRQPATGVLELRVRDGVVVRDQWIPASMDTSGRPIPLSGNSGAAAVADWMRLRDCTELTPQPPAG